MTESSTLSVIVGGTSGYNGGGIGSTNGGGSTGGGATGGAGVNAVSTASYTWVKRAGQGGTQSSGGDYGLCVDNTQCGITGSFGQGGGVFQCNTSNCATQSQAGGGGGWYGGGSARHAGGGGGSSYIGGIKDGTMTNGVRYGDGYAKITLISIVEITTPPIITGGNDSYSSTPITISIEEEGTAASRIKYYEYYISTSSEKPSDNITATGTTDNTVTIEDEGSYYIWYRTISNNDTKSDWSNYQKINIDTTNPTVTVSVIEKKATFTLKDNIGVIGYGVNQSSTTEPTYTSITSTTSTTQTWTTSTVGTYYVWVKDSAGNVAYQQFKIQEPLYLYNYGTINSSITGGFGYTGLGYGTEYINTGTDYSFNSNNIYLSTGTGLANNVDLSVTTNYSVNTTGYSKLYLRGSHNRSGCNYAYGAVCVCISETRKTNQRMYAYQCTCYYNGNNVIGTPSIDLTNYQGKYYIALFNYYSGSSNIYSVWLE